MSQQHNLTVLPNPNPPLINGTLSATSLEQWRECHRVSELIATKSREAQQRKMSQDELEFILFLSTSLKGLLEQIMRHFFNSQQNSTSASASSSSSSTPASFPSSPSIAEPFSISSLPSLSSLMGAPPTSPSTSNVAAAHPYRVPSLVNAHNPTSIANPFYPVGHRQPVQLYNSHNFPERAPETYEERHRKRLRMEGWQCASCGTNDTPLRRKGPRGRQTLCNACGLKYLAELDLAQGPGSGKQQQEDGEEESESHNITSRSNNHSINTGPSNNTGRVKQESGSPPTTQTTSPSPSTIHWVTKS